MTWNYFLYLKVFNLKKKRTVDPLYWHFRRNRSRGDRIAISIKSDNVGRTWSWKAGKETYPKNWVCFTFSSYFLVSVVLDVVLSPIVAWTRKTILTMRRFCEKTNDLIRPQVPIINYWIWNIHFWYLVINPSSVHSSPKLRNDNCYNNNVLSLPRQYFKALMLVGPSKCLTQIIQIKLNRVKDPILPAANQLAIYMLGRGFELGTTENKSS